MHTWRGKQKQKKFFHGCNKKKNRLYVSICRCFANQSTKSLKANRSVNCWTAQWEAATTSRIKKKKGLPSVFIFLALTHVSTQLSLHSLSSFNWRWFKGWGERHSVIKLFNWWEEVVTLSGPITCETHFYLLMGVYCRVRLSEGLKDWLM